MADLLFYQKPVPLNAKTHGDWRILTGEQHFGFAAEINSVLLAGIEFIEACKEYPIVFAMSGDSLVPVALLGLRETRNLFVSEDGRWLGRYIPAFIRRYPFVLADAADQNQKVVCIDEAYQGFNQPDGEDLFEDGKPRPVLEKAIEFLNEYQQQYSRTEALIKRLRDNELLSKINARVTAGDGQETALEGLLVVDEKKLLALDDEKSLALFRSGELAWIYAHLISIANIGTLAARQVKPA
jgi:hypothetical protein